VAEVFLPAPTTEVGATYRISIYVMYTEERGVESTAHKLAETDGNQDEPQLRQREQREGNTAMQRNVPYFACTFDVGPSAESFCSTQLSSPCAFGTDFAPVSGTSSSAASNIAE
jgi:hypothetical protein